MEKPVEHGSLIPVLQTQSGQFPASHRGEKRLHQKSGLVVHAEFAPGMLFPEFLQFLPILNRRIGSARRDLPPLEASLGRGDEDAEFDLANGDHNDGGNVANDAAPLILGALHLPFLELSFHPGDVRDDIHELRVGKIPAAEVIGDVVPEFEDVRRRDGPKLDRIVGLDRPLGVEADQIMIDQLTFDLESPVAFSSLSRNWSSGGESSRLRRSSRISVRLWSSTSLGASGLPRRALGVPSSWPPGSCSALPRDTNIRPPKHPHGDGGWSGRGCHHLRPVLGYGRGSQRSW